MLSPDISFGACLACTLIVAAGAGWKFGKENAIGVGMACSMLAATWYEIQFGAVPLNVVSATAAILMIAFCVHSGPRLWSPLTILDLVVGTLVVWHVIVDVHFGSQVALTAFRAYGEWALPYVAGRFAFQHRGSLARLSPWFVGVAAIISLLAMIETLTAFNLWEAITPRDDRVWFYRYQRYGLAYRSCGPTRHAIFLGVTLLTMIPMLVSVFDSSKTNLSMRSFAIMGMIAVPLGILSTVSRGPILAGILVAIGVLAYRYQLARRISAVAIIFAVAAILVFPDQLVRVLEKNPLGQAQTEIIQLEEGQEAEMQSGTRNRLLLIKVYGPLVIKGGLIGYGTEASAGFPPVGIPGLPEDPAVRKQVGIVDNSFIGMGLRFGIMGIVLLVACFIAAAATAFSLAPDASTYFYPHSSIALFVFGVTIVCVGLELMTVYFDLDHAFWVMFLMGSISGLKISTKSNLDFTDD